MNIGRTALSTILAISLASCGGGGGGSGGGASAGGGGPTSGGGGGTDCSLSGRQDFVKAVLDEWYLFPDLLSPSVNKSNYTDLQSYIDALVAPARAQRKDRYFTYITSIADEEALTNSGANVGFGIRLGYDTGANRVFVIEGFENAPGLAAGLDRGVELLAIGSSASNLQSVSALMASGGPQAVVNALGPDNAGVQRTLRIRAVGGAEQVITVTKAEYSLDPVSNRYGAKILDDGGKKVGYINLRTFIIMSAADDLRAAFNEFRQQGVNEVIVDLRYNGGGLVSIAELLGDLMGKGNVGQVFSYTTLRPSKSDRNETRLFASQAQAIAATKIAFIVTRSSASASELTANAFIPYLGDDMALVGTNTYGKPVGQFAFDNAPCDDRLRAIAFRTENANHQGDYFDGLAEFAPVTCRADDDIFTQLGDPSEASIAQALAFLRGGAGVCTPVSRTADSTAMLRESGASAIGEGRMMLRPDTPSAAQYQVPGLF